MKETQTVTVFARSQPSIDIAVTEAERKEAATQADDGVELLHEGSLVLPIEEALG